MDGWVYVAGVNVVMCAVVIGGIKTIVTTAIKKVEKQIETERESRIQIDNELWSAVNSHGHKGLNGDDARVTR